MKGFLSGFNSSRAMIVVFVVASIVLGMRALENQDKVTTARTRLGLDESSLPQAGLNAEVHGKHDFARTLLVPSGDPVPFSK